MNDYDQDVVSALEHFIMDMPITGKEYVLSQFPENIIKTNGYLIVKITRDQTYDVCEQILDISCIWMWDNLLKFYSPLKALQKDYSVLSYYNLLLYDIYKAKKTIKTLKR